LLVAITALRTSTKSLGYHWEGDRVRVQFLARDIHLDSQPGQLSLAIPSWVDAVSASQRAVTPCGWGVKADNG